MSKPVSPTTSQVQTVDLLDFIDQEPVAPTSYQVQSNVLLDLIDQELSQPVQTYDLIDLMDQQLHNTETSVISQVQTLNIDPANQVESEELALSEIQKNPGALSDIHTPLDSLVASDKGESEQPVFRKRGKLHKKVHRSRWF